MSHGTGLYCWIDFNTSLKLASIHFPPVRGRIFPEKFARLQGKILLWASTAAPCVYYITSRRKKQRKSFKKPLTRDQNTI